MSSAIQSNRNGVLWRRILVSAAVTVLAIALGVILLALNWPFTQTAVTKALEDRFVREVKIRKFRSTSFPPGFVAEGIEFLHRERKNLPPLITVQTLTLHAGYSGLLRIHKVVNDVQVAGLHVLVSCPGHNIIGSDPSDNYETESGGADDQGRTTERVEQVGCFTHVARR